MNLNDLHIQLPEWADPFMRPARWKSMRGGRGSGKSWTTARLMVMRMAGLLPDYPKRMVRIASCRDFNVHLQSSVKIAVEKFIHDSGLGPEFDIQNLKITHRKTESVMTFHGVTNNPDSFLSMDDIDVFWMEQAEALGEEMLKIEPTIRKPGSELWFVWNPHLRTNYCWKRFVLNPQPGDVSILVNYHDNPWWTDELESSRRYYEEVEPSLYPWIYLGEPNDGDAEHQILTYAMLRDCVKAWDMRPSNTEAPICDFGFDVAEGGRHKCATVGRIGPSVHHVDAWPGIAGDLDPAARRAHLNTEGFTVSRMYYDGASPMRGPLQRLSPSYSVRPINFGGEVGGKDSMYERGRSNGDVFSKRNIQMAMAVRLRAMRTARLLAGGDVDRKQCLFINPKIPKLETFLSECTKAIRRANAITGKWEMDKRGGESNAESPDRFDALCMAYSRDSDYGLRARI